MVAMRKTTLALGLFVAVALIVGGAFWLLRPEEVAVEPVVPTVDDKDPIPKPIESTGEHLHGDQFPFGAFQKDIDRLRVPVPPPDQVSYVLQEQEHNIEVEKHHFDIRLENATIKEIVDAMSKELATAGLTVTDLGRPLPDQFRFDIFMTDTHAYDVIGRILNETGGAVRYAYSEFGIVIGDEKAIQEWQIRTIARRAQENAATELDTDLLDALVPPITLENAHVGAVARYLTDQTGVEIIVSPELWHRPVRWTWKTDEQMKLREALRRLAKKHRAVIRVENERVFLIDP